MSTNLFDRSAGIDSELARLRLANAELEARLAEADDTLAAIRSGDVDALIVGEDIYTLDSANAASNALRRDVLSQMQDAVLAFDVDDHVIFMNRAAEMQYAQDASEALGRPRSDLFRERWPDAERALRAREDLRMRGSYRSESVHVRRDGREVHVECTVSTLMDGAQQPLGSLAVIRNIDDRVQAQATLAEAASVNSRRALLSRSAASICSCSVMLDAMDSTDSTVPSSANSGMRRDENTQDCPSMPLKRYLIAPTAPVAKTLRTARSQSAWTSGGMPISAGVRPMCAAAGTPL